MIPEGRYEMQDERVRKIMEDLIQYTKKRAIEYQTFTGAFIVKQDKVIWRDITSIEKDKNPLAHAELKALQGSLSIMGGDISGCQLYTTQQPCPMCASAIAWCGIEAVYYGLPSSHQWRHPGEMQDFFSNLGIRCTGPILEDECRAIDEWLMAQGI
jgi:tRNA(Arg) A34 adenosine deaminase TadA